MRLLRNLKIWEEVARGFEAKNPGVKVERQFLENEAYKAKLPTILQSKDRPHMGWPGAYSATTIARARISDGMEPRAVPSHRKSL
jgi:raffinose/stachyose/melibiose transport system substrate-binding protein